MIRIFIFLMFIFSVAACGSSDNNPAQDPPPQQTEEPPTESGPQTETPQSPSDPSDNPVVEQNARYKLTFNATWSAQSHATNFPGNPHFSGLVGAVHNNQIVFWEAGQIATAGIEEMAETGGKSALLSEVDAAIADGKAKLAVSGGGVAASPGSVEIEFEAFREYPLLTVTSMLAPSPDWFVGVDSFSLLDAEGIFIEQKTIDLYLYDSGTDSGRGYSAANEDTQPREIIQRLTAEPQDVPFVDGAPIVGQLQITKL